MDSKGHATKKKNDVIIERRTQHFPPATLSDQQEQCNIPYGTPPNVHEKVCSSRKEQSLPKIVSADDRKAHSEAYIVSFITEHTLPYAPHLIQFAQMLSSDVITLQKNDSCHCILQVT